LIKKFHSIPSGNDLHPNIHQVNQAVHKALIDWLSQLNQIILNQQLENACLPVKDSLREK
jgi:hypothetical protein